MDNLSLKEVARRLEEAEITWCVFAGTAASVYGAKRPVTDFDLLIPSNEGNRLPSIFPDAAVEREKDGVVHGIKLPNIDIIAGLDVMDLDGNMADRLTRHPVAGIVVPVIPPEDNILLKAVWGRGSEVGKHDWEDVEAMIAHVNNLDWDYLRWRAKMSGADHLLDRLRSLST